MFTVNVSPSDTLWYDGSTLIVDAAEAACIVAIITHIAIIVPVEYSLFNSIIIPLIYF
jgi:hypothetical protein